jgi:hypothetical protein
VNGKNGADKIFGAYAYEQAGHALYSEGTLADISESTALIENNIDGVLSKKIVISCGKRLANRNVSVLLGTPQPIPDLSSPNLPALYEDMIDAVSDKNIDGVASDEWGYDVILKIEEVNPYDDNNLFLRHLSVSNHFAAIYAENYSTDLYKDLFYIFIAQKGDELYRVKVINQYLATLRQIMAKNDLDMYSIAKKKLGNDIFYGEHPTWWGSVDSLYFEFFKNGFYWWEAIRDIAQTDEMVIIPIRTALAHKYKSPYWYNMWYSLGSRDINTYFTQTWNNVLFGGRTHYLGYECPNEAVVLELKPEGLLEQIEQMDSRVRLLDSLQNTQPDCRVLVLFGMEAVSNWALLDKPLPPWAPQSKRLDMVLNTANGLFGRYMCDLVPTSEIANGSLSVVNGKAVYGTQQYDAVLLLYPDSMAPSCYSFLQKLDRQKLAVCGNAEIYNNATPLDAEHAGFLKGLPETYAEIPSVEALTKLLESWHIERNRLEHACRYQDGSMIFTTNGVKACGNTLAVETEFEGHRLSFSGEDFLYLYMENGEMKAVFPKGELKIY